MKRTGNIKAVVIMLIMVGLVIGYYFYLTSRSGSGLPKDEDQVVEEMTVVQELLVRADYREYPSTPVQVLKYYNEITACFYNEKYTDNELEQLAMEARSLYDLDLIMNQTQEEYLSDLKDDIATFEAGNITILRSSVTPATDVDYFNYEGRECARLYAVYTLRSGTVNQLSKEVFIMRKDDEGHWKILGFELVKDEEEGN
ncbi:MAG: hypothetical protein K2J95_12435 [Lachnospiraceae bacterium]|nr:hypothetical protein [Lachnospiraceae bacterium]